jgi:diacylglycerol kinase family enzyme
LSTLLPVPAALPKNGRISKNCLKNTGLRFEHDITEAPGHAIELAKSAVNGKGYKLVVSVGGDGTINEIVNGLYNTGDLKDIELGFIGTGTGSDYIRTRGFQTLPGILPAFDESHEKIR